MPSHYENASAPIAFGLNPDNFARVCNTALRMRNWREPFIDRASCRIVAHQKDDQLIMGKNWAYRHSASISWLPSPEGVTGVVVQIQETNYDWTQAQCQQKFAELMQALSEAASQFSQAQGNIVRGARWASSEEVSLAGYIGEHSGRELILSRQDDGQLIRLPERETNRHALVCGPTGSGKTTGIFIPNLIERVDTCAVVTEATGGKGIADLFGKTAGYRAANGHRVFYFNPDAPNSHRINPIASIRSYRQARRACEIIMQSTTLRTHRGDQSWELSERMLLTALILHATSERKNGRCNLGFVNEMLNRGVSGLQHVFANTPVEEADRAFTRFIKTTTEGYRNLVINGVMNRLDAWNSPQVRLVTESTDIDFEALRDELWTIYLAVPANKPELKPLMALVFNDMLDYVISHQFAHPSMLMLDEFTNFGYVAGLPAKLTIIRHDGIPAVLGVQDYVQLELMYDKEAKLLISQPTTRVFFKPNDIDTAQKISQMLGDAVEESTRLTSGGHLEQRERKEPLLSADQLLNLGAIDEHQQTMEADKPNMIVFTPRTRPVQLQAFTWRDYQTQTDQLTYPLPEIPPATSTDSLTERKNQTEITVQSEPESEKRKDAREKDRSDDPYGDW